MIYNRCIVLSIGANNCPYQGPRRQLVDCCGAAAKPPSGWRNPDGGRGQGGWRSATVSRAAIARPGGRPTTTAGRSATARAAADARAPLGDKGVARQRRGGNLRDAPLQARHALPEAFVRATRRRLPQSTRQRGAYRAPPQSTTAEVGTTPPPPPRAHDDRRPAPEAKVRRERRGGPARARVGAYALAVLIGGRRLPAERDPRKGVSKGLGSAG